MAIKAQGVVDDVRKTLNDKQTTKRWSDSDLVVYLNEGMRTIALLRPDATAKTSAVALAAGTKQTLPNDGLRLLDVTRNMGADGNTPGAPINRADPNVLALFKPDWHTQAAGAVVNSFVYDDRNPKVYYIEPPITGSVYAEIVYSSAPTEVTTADLDVNLSIDDVYEAPLKDYMLSRAFGVEISSISSQNLSIRYMQDFASKLGLKWKIDMMVSPNISKGASSG